MTDSASQVKLGAGKDHPSNLSKESMKILLTPPDSSLTPVRSSAVYRVSHANDWFSRLCALML